MLKKLVIIPGGFHPFHAGHKALYDATVSQFPRADVYVAATDDQSERPFPFQLKQQLAQIAGIPKHRFIQVKSPFRPAEITDHYDPKDTQLIFVRSDKDSGVAPLPVGVKKDGSASYLQPYNRKKPEPMTQHGFMTYMPTVSFGPGMSSATEIRAKWPTMSDDARSDLIASLYPSANEKLQDKAKELFSTVLGSIVTAPVGAIGMEKPEEIDIGDKEDKVKEAKILVKGDDDIAIMPSGGLGAYDEDSLKANLARKLESLAELLNSGNYDGLEYHLYQSGAMQAMVEALGQYKRYKDKKGRRPIKKNVEIDISNEDYLPEEQLTEYVFQSRPLRVLDNIANRKDNQAFPIKFDDGSEISVTPELARKFMNTYYTKDIDIQKQIDQSISRKNIFIDTFKALTTGQRASGIKAGDIK